MDEDAIVELASRGSDVAAAYATSVNSVMQQRITMICRQTLGLRAVQLIAVEGYRCGTGPLASAWVAVAARHQLTLSVSVADVIAYGTMLGVYVPRHFATFGTPD